MKLYILLFTILTFTASYSDEFDLIKSSYLGGNEHDEITNVQSDKNGNIYVIGFTKSYNYPTTNGAYQKSNGGDFDIFLTKYDDNMAVIWSTYIGGNGREIIQNMAISDDAIWLVGETLSANYPVTNNAISKSHFGGSGDIIITKLSLDGELLYSSFFGGEGYDYAAAVAIDSDKNVWITGRTNSSNFKTTSNALKSQLDGAYDSYILKISDEGKLLYCSLIGGENSDYGLSISYSKIDNQVAISGFTDSSILPQKGTPLQSAKIGSQNQYDNYFMIFNSDCSLNWSSYYGGNGQDYPLKINYDSKGNLIAHIYTSSVDLKTDKNSFFQYNAGRIDNYLMKISRDKKIIWSSYFGGTSIDGEDNIFHKFGDMKVDKFDNIYVTAFTTSTNFPTTNNAKYNKLNGTEDCFLAKWSQEGELLYSSYLGGSKIDQGRSICVLTDKIIVTGWTQSPDFPTTVDAPYRLPLGGRDGFISVFGIGAYCKEEFNSDAGFSNIKLNTNKPIFEEDIFRLTDLFEYELGYMFYSEKVNIASGFESEFSFLISGGTKDAIKRSFAPTDIMSDNSLPGADGLAFIIAGEMPTDFIGDGGGIGYHGIKNAIAIEIDLWENSVMNDPNGNHLAILKPDNKGVLIARHSSSTTVYMNKDILTILSDSTQEYTCRVEYFDHNLKIYLNQSDKTPELLVELTDFPLDEYISLDNGSNGYVGLTSSTGTSAEYHDITHWDLCTRIEPEVINSVLSEKSKSISVYPNPLENVLSIDLPVATSKELSVIITDYLGREVYRRNTFASMGSIELNLSALLSGVYNLSVIEGQSNIYTTKIVKR